MVTNEERLAYYRKEAKKQQEKSESGGFNRPKLFKFKPGQNRIRIIPAFGDRIAWHADVMKSWNVGPTFRGPIIRPDQFGLPDPVADLIAKLEQGDEADKERAARMKAKGSIECFIIDRDNPEEGEQLVNLNWTVYNEILALFMDAEYGDITDPENGTDLKVNYTPGEKAQGNKWKKKPEYRVVPARERSPLDNPEAIEKCLFKHYRIEQPTDADFIEAVIAGREKEFIEEKKAARLAADSSAPTQEIKEESTPAPSTTTDDEVSRKLEEIRKAKAAKEAAPPPPAPAPAKEAPTLVVGTPQEVLDKDYWIVENDSHAAATGADVQRLVDESGDAEGVLCMVQGDAEWSNAKELGFVLSKSQVWADLEEAVK